MLERKWKYDVLIEGVKNFDTGPGPYIEKKHFNAFDQAIFPLLRYDCSLLTSQRINFPGATWYDRITVKKNGEPPENLYFTEVSVEAGLKSHSTPGIYLHGSLPMLKEIDAILNIYIMQGLPTGQPAVLLESYVKNPKTEMYELKPTNTLSLINSKYGESLSEGEYKFALKTTIAHTNLRGLEHNTFGYDSLRPALQDLLLLNIADLDADLNRAQGKPTFLHSATVVDQVGYILADITFGLNRTKGGVEIILDCPEGLAHVTPFLGTDISSLITGKDALLIGNYNIGRTAIVETPAFKELQQNMVINKDISIRHAKITQFKMDFLAWDREKNDRDKGSPGKGV